MVTEAGPEFDRRRSWGPQAGARRASWPPAGVGRSVPDELYVGVNLPACLRHEVRKMMEWWQAEWRAHAASSSTSTSICCWLNVGLRSLPMCSLVKRSQRPVPATNKPTCHKDIESRAEHQQDEVACPRCAGRGISDQARSMRIRKRDTNWAASGMPRRFRRRSPARRSERCTTRPRPARAVGGYLGPRSSSRAIMAWPICPGERVPVDGLQWPVWVSVAERSSLFMNPTDGAGACQRPPSCEPTPHRRARGTDTHAAKPGAEGE